MKDWEVREKYCGFQRSVRSGNTISEIANILGFIDIDIVIEILPYIIECEGLGGENSI